MNSVNELDVAIIGMAGRFPGAEDIDAFWENLKNGREAISFFSEDEMEVPVDPAHLRNPSFVRARGVLSGIDLFDAPFFNISAREAEWMDPQQRVFLECAWQALEHAGYDSFSCKEPISVYAGVNTNTYLLTRLLQLRAEDPATFFRILLSNDKDHLATRVAYKLNLRGESITVQTSCSTSLVALHLAYQSILTGQSKMALAGGISIQVPQKTGYFYQEGMVGSPDGHCRPFSAGANGTVPGNGVGIVVLKLLTAALKDRDTVYGVIKGSAINNDGHDKVGYTAPSVEGQTEVIARALALSGVHPEQISFIEAHGTGTALGDPIEVEALTRAFRKHTLKKNFCVLGAVKSMIGHLDNAAGVAGVIKVVLALQHGLIPPTLHFDRANPMLNLEESPFRVTETAVPWGDNGEPRHAGVSGFGIGGTNVHMVLGEFPLESSPASPRPQIVTLSARSVSALEDSQRSLAAHMEQHPQHNLADIAYTRNVGRRHFEFREYAVGKTLKEITQCLKAKPVIGHRLLSPKSGTKLAFLFPGQGAQKFGMMRELYETEPGFRRTVETCFEFVQAQFGLDLFKLIYQSDPGDTEAAERLTAPGVALPALFTVEYALARLWMDWGMRPDALLGHSFGEYVAACLADVFTLQDGLWLAVMRGRLMQQMRPGAMTAVRLPVERLTYLLSRNVEISAVNAQNDCTISGSVGEIEAIESRLDADRIAFRRLEVAYAYHSSMVDSILEEFRDCLHSITLKQPFLPIVSCLAGTWIHSRMMSPEYWVAQMRQTVRFEQSLACLGDSSINVCLEVGPGQTLTTLVRQNRGRAMAAFASFEATHRKEGEAAAMMHTLGRLWQTGFSVDWSRFYIHEERRRVPLPGYPFERKRYWVELAVPPDINSVAAESAASAARPPESNTGTMVKRALPSLRNGNGSQPANELEQVLLALWAEVLGQAEMGVRDSFFDLGSDSLTFSQAYARLKQRLRVEISLEEILSATTVEEVSHMVQREVKRAAGLEIIRTELPFYCIFHLPFGDESATVYMSEDEFKASGVPPNANELTFLQPATATSESVLSL
jgi:acyl transferase domain-containing protein